MLFMFIVDNLNSHLLIGDVKEDNVIKKVREHCIIKKKKKVLQLINIIKSTLYNILN